MVFSSLVFMFGFLPTVLAVYAIVPRRWKNGALLAASLIFYGWGEPIYVLLMLASILVAYGMGFLIHGAKQKSQSRAKILTATSVGINLSALFFFKYYNFLAGSVGAPVITGLVLPIGISFYTFQILSYTVDLYRGEIELQRDLIAFGTYVTLFPQLVAGPIVKYAEIDTALVDRRVTLEELSEGVSRFVCGLSKKLLLGDALAGGFRFFRDSLTIESTLLGGWLTAVFYSLHLYFDFSGYSDMAIGLGRMFGFRFPENFNYPYISKSIGEFWRRWHVTLSSWFRDYVYIPLGGSRRGRLRTCRNLLIVWLLTGFWHGAGWNFPLWGLYFGVLLMLEHLFLRRILERLPAFLRHVYTLTLVFVSFVIFSAEDLSEAAVCLSAMLGRSTAGFSAPAVTYRLWRYLPLLGAAAVGATPVVKQGVEKFLQKRPWRSLTAPLATVFLLLICMAYLVDSTFSPFAYFNF